MATHLNLRCPTTKTWDLPPEYIRKRRLKTVAATIIVTYQATINKFLPPALVLLLIFTLFLLSIMGRDQDVLTSMC